MTIIIIVIVISSGKYGIFSLLVILILVAYHIDLHLLTVHDDVKTLHWHELAETCFCQTSLNRIKPRFKPTLAETCQPCFGDRQTDKQTDGQTDGQLRCVKLQSRYRELRLNNRVCYVGYQMSVVGVFSRTLRRNLCYIFTLNLNLLLD